MNKTIANTLVCHGWGTLLATIQTFKITINIYV
jgi:hypothetical protein